MTHVACESKLYSFVRPYMHPCLGNCVAIGRAVVHYDRAAHAFSAGIKCRHCMYAAYSQEYVLFKCAGLFSDHLW